MSILSMDNHGRPAAFREFLRLCLSSAPLWKTRRFGSRALDIGCGRGIYFKINPSAYGMDIDTACLRPLKERGYKVIRGDICGQLPFRDRFFKCVICHDVLEHLEPEAIERLFIQVRRVLEEGGIFLVLVPNRKGFRYGLASGAGHRHFVTPEEIFSVAKGNFYIERHYPYPLPRFIGEHFTHNKEVILLRKPS